MTQKDRQLAECYAELASIPAAGLFEKPTADETARVDEVCARLVRLLLLPSEDWSAAATDEDFQSMLHGIVRGTLRDLFDGKACVALSAHYPPSWQLRGERLVKEVVPSTASQHSVGRLLAHSVLALVQLIEGPVFPFWRCPVCERVFVRVKRQRYCSPTCAYRAKMEGPQGDQKRARMRAYMAERRDVARAAALIRDLPKDEQLAAVQTKFRKYVEKARLNALLQKARRSLVEDGQTDGA